MGADPQPRRGLSPEHAYNTAIAAAHASGDALPEWIHPYLWKVATGEVDGDSAVQEVTRRILAELKHDTTQDSDQHHTSRPQHNAYGRALPN